MHVWSYFDGLQYAVYGWLRVNWEDKVAAVQYEGGSAHYYRSHGTHWAKLNTINNLVVLYLNKYI